MSPAQNALVMYGFILESIHVHNKLIIKKLLCYKFILHGKISSYGFILIRYFEVLNVSVLLQFLYEYIELFGKWS